MSPARDPRPRVRVLHAVLWLGAIALVLVGIDLAERFAFYEIRPRDRGSLARSVRRPVKDTAMTLLHGVSGPLDLSGLPEGIPVFDFHLKPDDAEELLARITHVRRIGTHDEFTKTRVAARMRVDGQTYDVWLKLRGRQHYHVVPPRPSLRVSLRFGRAYRNTHDFNLLEPFDKTTDQLFLWEAQQHGLIAWDSTMGILALDGVPLAVVQYVEQVRRETGDHGLRPEGMFFRGTGERYAEGMDPKRCGALADRVAGWLSDPKTTVPFEPMDEVMDLERFRWFTALTELSGDGHGFMNFNMKAYCDVVSPKVEFLIWDTRFGRWEELPGSQFGEQGTQFLRDDRFRALHDDALYTLATERVEPMLERMRAFEEAYGALLARDPFYWFPRGGPDGGFLGRRPEKLARTLRANAAAIRAALEGEQLAYEVDAGRRELRLATRDRGGKRVEALVLSTPSGAVERALPDPAPVYGRYRDRQPLVALALPGDVDPAAVVGVVAVNALTGRRVEARRAEAPLEGERVAPPRPAAPALPPLPPGLRVDVARRRIEAGPGELRVDGSLALPRGFALSVAPGTTLRLGPAAVFEVHGDLSMQGTQAAPIRVVAAGPETWATFAVVGERGARARVDAAWTTFVGGTGSTAGTTHFTGAVALYYADVHLDHVSVHDNQSEDALNVKYATIDMRDNSFRGGKSDAVDYDFVTGVDLRTVVEDFGNDGIDASGSKLRIEGARIRGTRDKGVSIGEGSQPLIRDVRIAEARIGCAVKDRADATVEDLTVVRSKTALALYQKKPSFGPSRAVFRRLVAADVGAFAILDHGTEAHFEDAVRIGEAEPPMRHFDGVENVVRQGLAALPLDALWSLADATHSTLASPEPATLGSLTGNRAGAGQP